MLQALAAKHAGRMANAIRFLTRRHPLPGSRPTGERLVFVGGAPRSGTTLVQHILDSHPQVFGGPEFDCIPAIIHAWRQVIGALQRGRITAFCTREQIDHAFGQMIESLLLPVADASHARLLSEKTPFNVLVMSDLLELFPSCRAIQVVRDPRAVISSLLRVGDRAQSNGEPAPDFTLSLSAAITLTRESLDAGLRAAEAFPGRMLTLAYEELVSDPEAVTRRLCSFLDLPFDARMLAPHATKHPAQDALTQLDKGTWVDPALGFRAIEPSRVSAWQSDLSPAQVRTIEAAFPDHPTLPRPGYRLAG